MKLNLIGHDRRFDTVNICTLFFPREGFSEKNGKELTVTKENDGYKAVFCTDARTWTAECRINESDYDADRKALKRAVYDVLQKATGISSPWGILTGVRPVRFYEKMHALCDDADRQLQQEYLVHPDKIDLCRTALRRQTRARAANLPGTAALYVSIPFCPSRCKYCSFVSQVTEQEGGVVPEYLKLLKEEILFKGAYAKENGDHFTTVYVGGGTPTTLSAEQLDELLATICRTVSPASLAEFTVEAGRPDTITPEKLSVLQAYGVNRISVNPQTLNDDVLVRVGRRHTAADFYRAYEQTRQTNLQINVDLIAGLPGDTPESFSATIDRIIDLQPENITVHTLYLKRAADYGAQASEQFTCNADSAQQMVSYAQKTCGAAGYLPYYLYRQKNTVGNLENVGYAKDGTESYYNIYMMDDLQTVYGAGANAMTKRMHHGTALRTCNTKYAYNYIKEKWKQP